MASSSSSSVSKMKCARVMCNAQGEIIVHEHCYLFQIDDTNIIRIPTEALDNVCNQIVDTGEEEIRLIFNETDETYNSNDDAADNNNQILASEEANVSTWTDAATKLLIDLYAKHKTLVENGKVKTLKRMWEIIKEIMTTYKYQFSTVQIENRWKTLERAFKNHVESKTKTGRARKFLPYEKELGDILLKRHSIKPKCVVTSKEIENAGSIAENLRKAETDEEKENCTRSKKFTTRPKQNLPVSNELKNLRDFLEKKEQNRMEMERKKVEQREEFLKEVKLKNKLMEKYLDSLNK